jgi:hypothetical protein
VKSPRYRANLLSQARLDIHVNVFESRVKGKYAALDFGFDCPQAGYDRFGVFGRDQLGPSEHLGMGDRASNIEARQCLVEVHGSGEALDGRIRGAAEATSPKLGGFCARHFSLLSLLASIALIGFCFLCHLIRPID